MKITIKKLLLYSLILLFCMSSFFLFWSTIRIQTQKEHAVSQTTQRPSKLPFQALARFNDPPTKQSSIIFYFHPECDHCSYEAEAIQKQLEDFRSTQLIWISAADSSSIRRFAQQHQLDQVPNVHWMSDTADVFASTFGSGSVPSVWIYGQDGQLLKHYKGETKPAALLKYLHDDKTRH